MVPMASVNTDEIVVETLLGAGSYGVVVRVRLERRGGRDLLEHQQQHFALKLQSLETETAASTDMYRAAMTERQIFQRIWREIDAETGAVGHPLIVKLVCASEWREGRQLFFEGSGEPVQTDRGLKTFHCALMMEYCPLGSLSVFMSTRMRRGVDNEDPHALRWLLDAGQVSAEVLLALDFLHNVKNVVYRDLKPDNILIVGSLNQPHIKLSDFGLSKVVNSLSFHSTVGTPYFMAPELFHRTLESPTRLPWHTDTFSFGMMLFVLFYGCDLYEVSDHGALTCVPPQSIPAKNNHLEWISLDRADAQYGERPHPLLSGDAGGAWETALARLGKEPQCPTSVVQLINECTSLNVMLRPTVDRLRTSAVFKRQGSLPAIDWSHSLRSH